MIVVDVNVIAYLLIEGDKTEVAQKIYLKDPLWAVPALWQHEFLNILATLGRSSSTPLNQLQALWHNASTRFANYESPVNKSFALDLAHHHRITTYDAQYLTLAMELKTICVTEDAKLRRVFPEMAFSMKEFYDF